MDIEISRREVLNNLIRFKDTLLEMRADEEKTRWGELKQISKEGDRSYKVLLNRHTGDMRFAQKISSLQKHFPQKRQERGEDWKEVRIRVISRANDKTRFEVVDDQNHSLTEKGLDPLAWRIAYETVDVLNLKAKETNNVSEDLLPEEWVLKDLTNIHLSSPKNRIEDLPGWRGAIDRIEAEKILHGRPVGSYVLRHGDKTTEIIAFQIGETNRILVHPFLLTLVEGDKKITDLLLLQTSKGWIHYQDDPDLRNPFYKYHLTPESMIQTFHSRARFPVNV
jgi:hypothetical protein